MNARALRQGVSFDPEMCSVRGESRRFGDTARASVLSRLSLAFEIQLSKRPLSFLRDSTSISSPEDEAASAVGAGAGASCVSK